jgi:hypothetical protein
MPPGSVQPITDGILIDIVSAQFSILHPSAWRSLLMPVFLMNQPVHLSALLRVPDVQGCLASLSLLQLLDFSIRSLAPAPHFPFVAGDLKHSGLPDPDVYQLAVRGRVCMV